MKKNYRRLTDMLIHNINVDSNELNTGIGYTNMR